MSAPSISRTAHETFFTCPRQRWLGYEIHRGHQLLLPDGTTLVHIGGLTSDHASIPMAIGTGAHVAFAHMLTAVQGWQQIGEIRPDLKESGEWLAVVQEAVGMGLEAFENEGRRGWAFEAKDDQEFRLAEARAMVEGLGWTAGLRLVPEIAQRYRVVEVEREERFEMIPARAFAARADALLEETASGDLMVFSLKTGTVWTARDERRFRRDVQGLSEAIAIDKRLAGNGGGRVAMVQMALLLKGIRRGAGADDGSSEGKLKRHSSPLTRCWYLENEISGRREWAWTYHVQKISKDGNPYQGNLGKGWRMANVWEAYPGGVQAWVQALDRGMVQPEAGDPFAGCMVLPEPWPRSDLEMISWERQARAVEERVDRAATVANALLAEGQVEKLEECLDREFPQNRRSCVQFASSCPMDAICWGSGEVAARPLENGYRLREDHHGEVSDGE